MYYMSMAGITDEEISRKVQAGEVHAFGVLIERYEEKLKRYARRFLFDAEEAKDLVQEVFIKAYMNIKSFDATRRFSPWLYRVAHNEFVNAGKKKARAPVSPVDFDLLFPAPVAVETADSELTNHEIRQLLDQCLQKIDTKYREPLVLYYFEDLDYRAISDVMQIPVATVGVRLSRGKEMLKKLVSELDPALVVSSPTRSGIQKHTGFPPTRE